MSPIQQKFLEVAGSAALATLTARLFTSTSSCRGAMIGAANGLTVALISSNEKKHPTLYSIGGLALLILAHRALAPLLQGRVDIPSTKDLMLLAIPPALYTLIPKQPKTDWRPKQPLSVHLHKTEEFAKKPVVPSDQRMKKNIEKAIKENYPQDKNSFIAPAEISKFKTHEGPLTLAANAVTNRGNRASNEDTYVMQTRENGADFYGVFDGHGGDAVSKLCRENSAAMFKNNLTQCTGDVLKAFEATVLQLHKAASRESGGSTAVMCYFDPQTNRLYTATLADAEANIYRKVGETLKSIPLSPLRNLKTDENKFPQGSITKRDSSHKGWRTSTNTGSSINFSRAIGDRGFPQISQKPKVTMIDLLPGDILVLCSDGLKDYVDEKKIVEIISSNQSEDPVHIARALTDASATNQKCLRGDNVTAIVVKVGETQ